MRLLLIYLFCLQDVSSLNVRAVWVDFCVLKIVQKCFSFTCLDISINILWASKRDTIRWMSKSPNFYAFCIRLVTQFVHNCCITHSNLVWKNKISPITSRGRLKSYSKQERMFFLLTVCVYILDTKSLLKIVPNHLWSINKCVFFKLHSSHSNLRHVHFVQWFHLIHLVGDIPTKIDCDIDSNDGVCSFLYPCWYAAAPQEYFSP